MAADTLNPARILVRGVNWLGDAVMTTPALLRLRERFPHARISMLIQEKLGDLWTQHPALDEALLVGPGESTWQVVRRLREKAFDLALILPNSPRSALEPWLARIPMRIGYGRGWRALFLTRALPTRDGHVTMHKRTPAEVQTLLRSGQIPTPLPPVAHQVHDYLALIASLGGSSAVCAPQVQVSDKELLQTQATLLPKSLHAGIEQPIFLGLNPGAEYGPAKRWPIESFSAAALQITRRFPSTIWLMFGSKADIPTCNRIADTLGPRSINLAGATSLRQLMCLLKGCRLVLTNDTGPMHVAAALGTPVIVPFGSTSPELTGPGLPGDPRHQFLRAPTPCAPCFLRHCPIDFRCMIGITVDQVVSAIARTLS
jgi:heptosyltransferase-2